MPGSDETLANKFETIEFDVMGHVATITRSRPDQYNSFTQTMCEEMQTAWGIGRDTDGIHVAALRANGDKAFCTGIDVKAGAWWTDDNIWTQTDPGEYLGPRTNRVWKPVICAVQGMCAGGAQYMVNERDIVVAAHTTGMAACSAILAAYLRRLRTGDGECIEISMQEALMSVMRSHLLIERLDDAVVQRRGNPMTPPTDTYPCAPGGPNDYVNVTAPGDKLFDRFALAIGRPDLVIDERFATHDERRRHGRELREIVTAWTQQRTKWEAMAELVEADVPASAVFDPDDLQRDPHLIERGALVEVEHERRGTSKAVNNPVRSTSLTVDLVAAPRPGEHTASILAELGRAPGEIRDPRSGRRRDRGGRKLDMTSHRTRRFLGHCARRGQYDGIGRTRFSPIPSIPSAGGKMPNDEPVLLTDVTDRIGTITLHRPNRRNALNGPLIEALDDAVRKVAADDEVKVVILTGAPSAGHLGGFCAGGDVKDGSSVVAPDGTRRPTDAGVPRNALEGDLARHDQHAAMLLHLMPKPTIAMIGGPAVGAGLSLAAASDLRLASDDAVFVASFTVNGLSGDYGGTFFWTRILGTARTRELYLLNDKISAPTALEWGMVNAVHPAEELRDRTLGVAQKLLRTPTTVLELVKDNLNNAEDDVARRRFLFANEAANQTRAGQNIAARMASRSEQDS